MANNLEIQAQFNKMLEEADKLLEKQTKHYQSQAHLMAEMVRAQQVISGQAEPEKYEALASALEKAAEKAETFASSSQQMSEISDAIEKAVNNAGGLNKTLFKTIKTFEKLSVAKQGLLGLGNGFAFVGKTLKTTLSVGGALLKTVGSLTASIISFPFKILQNLIDEASHGGSNELALALEEIREQLGYLKKQGGGAVVELGRSMRGELANTGLSVYRVFGNLAERMKYFLEYAKALGPVFDTMASQIGEGGGEALGAFNKALGLSGEAQRGIATRAMATGKTINEVNRQIANYALQLSDQFGVTMKEVARSVGEMMHDFENFGHLAPKQLTQVAVYARKLGIEIKSLQGIMEKTLNFEDAAQQAAQLSQAFGLNIDALEQMKEQDPGKQLDNLRKAFFAAGRSIDGMTRQERKLLQQQTGLDAASLDLAFSLKNQSLSYDQIQKKGAAAERKQISQAEAMEKLAGAIKRLVNSGDLGSGGFFDRFLRGINAGMKRTSEWRHIMMNLRQAMMATFQAGVQVGRMIVKVFPGVKEVFKGIADFFEPRKFRTMLQKVVEGFRTFFNDLTVNPRQALPKLLEKLRKGFFDYFSSNTAPGKKLLDGTKHFFMAFAAIGNSYLKIAGENLNKGIKFIIGLLTGTERIDLSGAARGGRGALGFFGPIIANLIDGLGPIFNDLFNNLKTLTGILWTKFKAWIAPQMPKIILGMFGPSIVMAVTRMLAASLITAFADSFMKAVTSNTLKKVATKALVGEGSGIIKQAMNVLQHAPKEGIGNIAGITRASNVASEAAGTSKTGPGVIKQLLLMAGVVAIGLGAMFAAVQVIRRYRITNGELIKSAGMVLATVPLMLASSVVVKTLSAMPKGNIKDIAIGLLFVAGTATLMAVQGALIVSAIRKFKFSATDVARAGLVMGAISALYLAASAVVAVGGAIGGIVAATGGIGAVAIIGGVAFIGLVVQGMVEHGMELMKKINSFKGGPGFEGKARVFLGFIKAIGDFAANLGSIVASAAPGIIGTITSAFFGNDPQQEMQKTLGQVTKIISAIGTEIINLLSAIDRYTRGMSSEQLEKGKAIGDMLGGISNLSKALVPPSELLKDTAAWWEGSDVARKLTIVGDSIASTARVLSNIVRTIADIFQQIAPISRAGIGEAGAAMANIMGAIGTLAQNMTPRAATIQALNGSRDFAGALGHVRSFMRTFLTELIQSNILNSFGTFVTSFLTGIQGLSARDIEKVKVVGPVVGKAFEAIAQLSSLLVSVLPANPTQNVNPEVIRSLTGFMTVFLDNIKNTLPRIMTSFANMANGITPAKAEAMKKSSEAIAGLFQTINTIPTLVSSFSQQNNQEGGATNLEARARAMGENIGMALGALNIIVNTLFDSNLLNTIFGKLGTLTVPQNAIKKLEGIGKVFDVMGKVPTVINKFQESVPSGTNVNTAGIAAKIGIVVGGVNSIVNTLTSQMIGGVANPFLVTSGNDWIGSKISALSIPRNLDTKISKAAESIEGILSAADRISSVSVRPHVAESVRAMISEANAVSRELSQIEPINIQADLKKLAHNLGLGASGRLQIQQTRVTINASFEIKVDAKKFEEVLVDRADSRIAVTNGR